LAKGENKNKNKSRNKGKIKSKGNRIRISVIGPIITTQLVRLKKRIEGRKKIKKWLPWR